jgi:hypothetical protein
LGAQAVRLRGEDVHMLLGRCVIVGVHAMTGAHDTSVVAWLQPS